MSGTALIECECVCACVCVRETMWACVELCGCDCMGEHGSVQVGLL